MALRQYDREFHIEKRKLNVVICVCRTLGLYKKSEINKMLEQVQIKLREEYEDFEEIQIAYVYENSSLEIRNFEKLEKDTPIQYQELYGLDEKHSMVHIVFMGLALLEQKLYEKWYEVENRLYLITDEKFNRFQTKMIVQEKNGELFLHPRFSQINVDFILFKTENAGGDLLEEYIRRKGNVEVFRPDKNIFPI